MHTLGHPVDLDALLELCEKYKLIMIEDAAEALGSFYKNVHVGHRGLLGALSFNGNKIITSGGGGAILTNHENLAKAAKYLTTTAKRPHAWEFLHDRVGYNYRLPNINAALGCAQLEHLPKYLAAKRSLMKHYTALFSSMDGLTFIKEPSFAKSNHWLNAFLLNEENPGLRDELLAALNLNGIMTRPLWNLQHTLPMYADCPRMPLPIAESLSKKLIEIPSSPKLLRTLVTEPAL
jgi:perosamine synthetase